MIKKNLGHIVLGVFVLACIALGVYNFKNNVDFLKAPLSTIMSILIAVIVSYLFVQKKTDDRRKREKIDKLLYKIQDLISVSDFTDVKEGDLILHRSIANKIEFLENNTEDNLKEEAKKLKETFNSYRDFYGNHYADADYMSKSKVELMNYIKLIDDTCDKMHMKLL